MLLKHFAIACSSVAVSSQSTHNKRLFKFKETLRTPGISSNWRFMVPSSCVSNG